MLWSRLAHAGMRHCRVRPGAVTPRGTPLQAANSEHMHLAQEWHAHGFCKATAAAAAAAVEHLCCSYQPLQ